jgi:glycosyltransferase involved in cell wall biosynthesis
MAAMDHCATRDRSRYVSAERLRVGLDLDGSLESFGNSMTDLANALDATGECSLVRFRTRTRPAALNERRVALRALSAPLWRRSLGPSIDRRLGPLDVIHLAGRATPPTRSTPLVISVDDLRPLRAEKGEDQRVAQLRRAVRRGAVLVASTRSARHEVQGALALERARVVVVPPAVPLVDLTLAGTQLVVNLTGVVQPFLRLAPELVDFARRHHAEVVAVTSAAVAQRIRAQGLEVTLRSRADARGALAVARVVLHVSDGARFPSFAIAALAAGVPTIARATAINRELLAGAAALTESDEEVIPTLAELWESPTRRAIMIAAGRARADDFAPATAARAYLSLYRDVVRGWNS